MTLLFLIGNSIINKKFSVIFQARLFTIVSQFFARSCCWFIMSKLIVRLGFYLSVTLLTAFAVFISLLVTPIVLSLTDEKITVVSYLIATVISLIVAPSVSSLFISQFFKIYTLEKEIREIAMYDEMTGFLTRRFFLQYAESHVSLANRAKTEFAIMVLDIDNFKKINDKYGHMAGDKVLNEFGLLCLKHKRKEDFFGRTGGEEFTFLLPNVDASGAKSYAEKIRQQVERLEIEFDQSTIRCTVSVGFVSYLSSKVPLESLIRSADDAMYRAKKTGRNQTVQGSIPSMTYITS